MVVIYIRHSNDSKRKQVSSIRHRDDLKITPEGLKLARKTGKKLIKMYGEPSIIYLSPFMRAKETLKEMSKNLKGKPKIKFDNRLSRYFSSSEKKDPSCFTETFDHEIPIYENWDEFKDRVHDNLKSMKKRGYIESKKVIWCITHALPFIQISRVCRIKIPKDIPFMYHFRVRDTRIKYIDKFFESKEKKEPSSKSKKKDSTDLMMVPISNNTKK